jgi:hypothetical protein
VEDLRNGGDIHFSVIYCEKPMGAYRDEGAGVFLDVVVFDEEFEKGAECRKFITMGELECGGILWHQAGYVAIEIEREAPWDLDIVERSRRLTTGMVAHRVL